MFLFIDSLFSVSGYCKNPFSTDVFHLTNSDFNYLYCHFLLAGGSLPYSSKTAVKQPYLTNFCWYV